MQRFEAKSSNLFNQLPQDILLLEVLPWLNPLEVTRLNSTNRDIHTRVSEATQYTDMKKQLISLGCKESDLEKVYEFEQQQNNKINYLFLYQTLSKMSQAKRDLLTQEDLLFLTGETRAIKQVLDNKNFGDMAEKQKYIDFAFHLDKATAITASQALMQKFHPDVPGNNLIKLITDLITSYKNLENSVKIYPNNTMLFNAGTIVCLQAREVAAEILTQPQPSQSQANLLSQCMNSAEAVLKNPLEEKAINNLLNAANKAPGNEPSGAWHVFKGVVKIFCGAAMMVVGSLLVVGTLGLLSRPGNYLFHEGSDIIANEIFFPRQHERQHLSAGLFRLFQDAKTHKTEIEANLKKHPEEKKVEIKIDNQPDSLRTPLLGRNRSSSND